MLITMILIHLNKLFEKSCSIDDYQKFIVTETISVKKHDVSTFIFSSKENVATSFSKIASGGKKFLRHGHEILDFMKNVISCKKADTLPSDTLHLSKMLMLFKKQKLLSSLDG